jgi:superfamily II DNA helicase RecQ
MDIPDVSCVIQFMVPPMLSVWTQCLGRAGRSGEPAIVILLVEPSVYKLKKSRGVVGPEDPDGEDKDDEDEDVGDGESDTGPVGSADLTYQKKVEEGMRKWIEATKCRRIVADTYFNNPPRTTGK